MDLLYYKQELVPIPGHDDAYKTGITGRRRVLRIGNWSIRSAFETRSERGWYETAIDHFMVGVNPIKKWRFGYVEVQYDGIHHVINIGPFYINWHDFHAFKKDT